MGINFMSMGFQSQDMITKNGVWYEPTGRTRVFTKWLLGEQLFMNCCLASEESWNAGASNSPK